MYDTPARHPRISIEEREYIEKALATRKDAKVYSVKLEIKISFLCPLEQRYLEAVEQSSCFRHRFVGGGNVLSHFCLFVSIMNKSKSCWWVFMT